MEDRAMRGLDWKIQEFMQRDRPDFIGVQDDGPKALSRNSENAQSFVCVQIRTYIMRCGRIGKLDLVTQHNNVKLGKLDINTGVVGMRPLGQNGPIRTNSRLRRH